MSTTTDTTLSASRRKRELFFFLFGSGVFVFSLTVLGIVCVVCSHPATVALTR